MMMVITIIGIIFTAVEPVLRGTVLSGRLSNSRICFPITHSNFHLYWAVTSIKRLWSLRPVVLSSACIERSLKADQLK